ncbi:16S rRNA (uracil(1498)-N(3))-methyltransferase [Hydrogenophaga sp.]|uniref:16S rRNA (uracil(1498)-N(3))-methyltransferase n=1 Tax=Hydrogenophaga sp. TaxID=1904254 RepID=UPI0026036B98|nr:16S rRNA (uracil(1498)-N(3))-methyltransferase [Hydrogenophaga sp.]MCW5654772.1 16S rRNA (uracil(1498)-N(3))-methyltransferase [Hydrogenophaga sp.]
MPRLHCPVPLVSGQVLALPAVAARHAQVLRLQPGHAVTLFQGTGGEWDATISRMGRSDVEVQVGAHHATEREPRRPVHLALGMPANERMDWLVEKATELGVASVQPLHTAHSVLRLSGERAEKKQAHWRSVAIAACEQCGGNRVPDIHAVQELTPWLRGLPAPAPSGVRCLLSLAEGTQPLSQVLATVPTDAPVWFLGGPEGGLSAAEDQLARQAGFLPVTLGARVLRSETAALAALMQSVGG